MKKILIPASALIFSFATFSSTIIPASASTEITKIETTNTVTSQVLEGTEDNWTKLKVTDAEGKVEFIEKKVKNGTETYNIYSPSHELTNTVIREADGDIKVNGEAYEPLKVVETSTAPTTTSPRTASTAGLQLGTEIGSDTTGAQRAVVDVGTGFYLKSTINSSYSSDWGTVATGVAVLVSIFGGMGSGIASSLASYIISEKLPQVWYTKKTYWDKKQYHPTYKIYTTHYGNPARTEYIKTANYVY